MTFYTQGTSPSSLTAYHLIDSEEGASTGAVRVAMSEGVIDLGVEQRINLAAYLMDGLSEEQRYRAMGIKTSEPAPVVNITPIYRWYPVTSTHAPVGVTAKDFELKYDEHRTFPFYEDENAEGVYGYGHTDKAEFAAAVTEYDRYTTGEFSDEVYTADDVHHGWAVGSYNEYDEMMWSRAGATEVTPGAFPMTWVDR